MRSTGHTSALQSRVELTSGLPPQTKAVKGPGGVSTNGQCDCLLIAGAVGPVVLPYPTLFRSTTRWRHPQHTCTAEGHRLWAAGRIVRDRHTGNLKVVRHF